MRGTLTEAQKIEILRLRNEKLSIRKISEVTGIAKSTIGDFVAKSTYKDWWGEGDKPIAGGELFDHRENVPTLVAKTFIVTSAQNNTFVHNAFLASLEQLAKRHDAQIIVGTFSYNKNGFQNGVKGDEGDWYDPKITPYIMDKPAKLAKDLLWCGELNILPTATNPLSGFHSYTRNMSGIIPHAKVQLESLPSHKSEPARMLYTTGAVTQRNYIPKKSGQKASFHHIFGALIVQVDNDGDWFVRQLIADSDTGHFYDLDTLYTPDGWEGGHRIEAVNWGDVHVEKMDKTVFAASIADDDSILNTLKPRYQFIHDVLDFEARNHHNISDPYFRFQMHKTEKDNVKNNVTSVAKFLKMVEREYSIPVVVESNHDLAFQRWLKEADYRTDPENAIYYLENQLVVYKAIEAGIFREFSIFEHAVKSIEPDLKSIFLRTDESFKICNQSGNGIECGSHGHNGANGSRGSLSNFVKLGTRHNVGHSHTAAIRDGVYYAGVSGELDMGYNKGASSWSHSHIITYKNGKRTIITLKNGKWK